MHQFGIFAKYWRPGSVKTRLAATVGPALAAEFHRACLVLLLDRLHNVAGRRVLAVWPPEDVHEFQSYALTHWELAEQAPGDLGTKMSAYFDVAFANGATKVVLVGSDSPTVSGEDVLRAYQALDQNDVVLGPTSDGGYYLVGCRAKTAPIFDGVAWSTPEVWQQTLTALRSANCSWHELPGGFDVDEIDDVRQLRDQLNISAFSDPTWEPLREICDVCLRAASIK